MREPLSRWVALIGLVLNMFIFEGTIRCFGLVYLEFLEIFQQGALTTSWVTTTFSLVTMVTSPISGGLSDRFAIWKLLAVGGLVGSVSMMACAFSPSIAVVIITWGFGFGFSNGIITPVTLGSIPKLFPYSRNLVMGMAFAGGSCGGIVLPYLYNYLGVKYSARGMLIVASGLILNVLLSAVFVWSLYHRGLGKDENGGSKGYAITQDESYREVAMEELSEKEKGIVPTDDPLVKNGSVPETLIAEKTAPCCPEILTASTWQTMKHLLNLRIACYFLFVLGFGFGFYGFVIYLPPFAKDIGYGKLQIPIFLSVLAVSDLIGRLVIGFIGNLKCTNIHLMLIMNMFVGIAAVILLSFWKTMIFMSLMLVVTGFCVGGSASMIGHLVVLAVGEEFAGVGIGIGNFGFGAGLALCPVISGAIYDQTGTYRNVPYLAAVGFGLSALAVAIGERFRILNVCRKRSEQAKSRGG